MSQKYKVIWADIAENDLKNIIEFIANDSLSNAQKVFDKITEKASGLYILPERGRLVPELKDQGILQYRELIHFPWRIIYRISENKVYVLSVIDSRRNIEDILLKRLLNQEI
ncbi:MAG: type II toxin-antitoxin system RelE/ParE family toxin [Deltaproteobacteria bacterium]|nr:type II toxin-antitoxin system RelE/ParE family toxin [Deltaproteobacteria bacterium]